MQSHSADDFQCFFDRRNAIKDDAAFLAFDLFGNIGMSRANLKGIVRCSPQIKAISIELINALRYNSIDITRFGAQ